MKILRHNGQKVLEAPIDFDVIPVNGKDGTTLIVDLITVHQQVKYMMLLDMADIAALRQILITYQAKL